MATWNINQLDCYPELDGKTDVVFTAHWNLSAEEVDGDKTYTGYVYGSIGLTLDPEEPYTEYANLTKEQVVGWVKDAMGEETVAAHEAAVAQQIENQKNPPVVSPKLPWATPAA